MEGVRHEAVALREDAVVEDGPHLVVHEQRDAEGLPVLLAGVLGAAARALLVDPEVFHVAGGARQTVARLAEHSGAVTLRLGGGGHHHVRHTAQVELAADLLDHLQAVAKAPLEMVEGVLGVRESDAGQQLLVVGVAAGTHDDRLAVEPDDVAVPLLGEQAAHRTGLVGEYVLGGHREHDLPAERLYRGAHLRRVGRRAAARAPPVECVDVTAAVVVDLAGERDAGVGKPADVVTRRLDEVEPARTGDAAVVVAHLAGHDLARLAVDTLLDLHLAADAEHALRAAAAATCARLLLEHNDAQALLGGLQTGGKTRDDRADNHNVAGIDRDGLGCLGLVPRLLRGGGLRGERLAGKRRAARRGDAHNRARDD